MGSALSRHGGEREVAQQHSSAGAHARFARVGEKRGCCAIPTGVSAHSYATERLQLLLEELRPTRADSTWTTSEHVHLFLNAWLGGSYPLYDKLPQGSRSFEHRPGNYNYVP